MVEIGMDGSVAERQALGNAILVRLVNQALSAQTAAALGVLGLHQMPPASARTQHLAAGRDLEPFRHRLLRFNAFWTSHRFAQFSFKRARNIGSSVIRSK